MTSLNTDALVAVVAFAGALLLVFGLLYRMAARSVARGELSPEGVMILRWALVGYLAIFAVLAVTSFLS